MHLFLVRHGESEANAVDLWWGSNDPGLTARGRRQSRWAGHYLSKNPVDVLYCGPLQRNLETAQHIAEITGMRPRLLRWMFEAGANQAVQPWEQLSPQFPEIDLEDDCPEWPRENLESRSDAMDRAAALLHWLRKRFEETERHVGIVSHGTFSDLLLCSALRLEPADYIRFATGNCAFHWIEIVPAGVKVWKLNSECHIPTAHRT